MHTALSMSKTQREKLALFYLGPTHSGAYWHEHTSAFNALFYGRKRWFLLPPMCCDSVGPFAESMVGWMKDYAGQPVMPYLDFIQEPGVLHDVHIDSCIFAS